MADKNIGKDTQYRSALSKDGKYYNVQARLSGSSEWYNTGNTSTTKEGAEQMILNITQGKTVDGSRNISEVPKSNAPMKFSPETRKAAMETLPSAPAKQPEVKPASQGKNFAKVLEENGGDYDKAAEWINNNPGYKPGDITKAGLAKAGYEFKDGKFVKAEEKKEELSKEEPKEELPKEESKTEPKEAKDNTKPAEIGKYLARGLISAYKNGQFGNIYSGKKNSELTPEQLAERRQAKRELGYYLLDSIGSTLARMSSRALNVEPTTASEWSKVSAANEETNKQIRDLNAKISAGKELTAGEQALAQRFGILQAQTSEGLGTTGTTINVYQESSQKQAKAEGDKSLLEVKNLEQNQKQVATQNLTALIARKKELQTLIADLKADKGWDSYRQAMDAYVGTARGLESTGLSDNASEAVSNGSTLNASADVGTGKFISKFVNANISGSGSWTNSSTTTTGKTTTMSEDALAKAKFKDGEQYAEATREARISANEQLIANLQSEIDIIDKAIQSWGKDLGVSND